MTEKKKGPGRPERETKDIQVPFRLNPSLRKAYQDAGDAAGKIPLGTYIRIVLEKTQQEAKKHGLSLRRYIDNLGGD